MDEDSNQSSSKLKEPQLETFIKFSFTNVSLENEITLNSVFNKPSGTDIKGLILKDYNKDSNTLGFSTLVFELGIKRNLNETSYDISNV